MLKVSITNSRENKLWEAKFASEELAQAWLAQQVGKPHRLPEREVAIESEYFQDDVLEVISEDVIDSYTYSDGVDGEGNSIQIATPVYVSTQTKVRLAAQYVATVTDVTVAHDLEQAQIAARKLLADTDWYCSRLIETSVAIPAEISAQRAAARLLL